MIAEELRQIGGRPTRIQTAGQGPTLVWLHDSLGNRWSPGQDRLSERFRLLAPTLPGFEDSAALAGIDGPEDVVFWLLDLLDGLELARPTVVGCGLGGWMAAELAVRYPERLGGL